jgi:DNA-binding transcriptional ArsR family regulator
MISKEVFEMQSRLCQAMSSAARLEIIHLLRSGRQPVRSLAEATGLGQATLSRHLTVLRTIGLVTVQRQGQENIYQLANPKMAAICDLMLQILDEQLTHQAEIASTIKQ